MVPLDPRLPALFAEADALVGIDEPAEELVNWLTKGGEKLGVKIKCGVCCGSWRVGQDYSCSSSI